jgi:uncharacterized protein YndB with AHSA1/START domain
MGSGRFVIRSERTYHFPVSRDVLWKLLGQVEDFRTWWPWVKRLDATGLIPGADWQCTIEPPLPYKLHGTIHLDEVEEPSLLVATLSGDLVGDARMELADNAEGSEVYLVTELAAASGPIRMISRALPGLARWGHDWVLDTAAAQFRAHALRPAT